MLETDFLYRAMEFSAILALFGCSWWGWFTTWTWWCRSLRKIFAQENIEMTTQRNTKTKAILMLMRKSRKMDWSATITTMLVKFLWLVLFSMFGCLVPVQWKLSYQCVACSKLSSPLVCLITVFHTCHLVLPGWVTVRCCILFHGTFSSWQLIVIFPSCKNHTLIMHGKQISSF